ncbi:hypothetical protein J6590_014842 [Homalodisca vitripennis]|nr:hypothetical protein J6590_014842 [Homalodisca vitripennis]
MCRRRLTLCLDVRGQRLQQNGRKVRTRTAGVCSLLSDVSVLLVYSQHVQAKANFVFGREGAEVAAERSQVTALVPLMFVQTVLVFIALPTSRAREALLLGDLKQGI